MRGLEHGNPCRPWHDDRGTNTRSTRLPRLRSTHPFRRIDCFGQMRHLRKIPYRLHGRTTRRIRHAPHQPADRYNRYRAQKRQMPNRADRPRRRSRWRHGRESSRRLPPYIYRSGSRLPDAFFRTSLRRSASQGPTGRSASPCRRNLLCHNGFRFRRSRSVETRVLVELVPFVTVTQNACHLAVVTAATPRILAVCNDRNQ